MRTVHVNCYMTRNQKQQSEIRIADQMYAHAAKKLH